MQFDSNQARVDPLNLDPFFMGLKDNEMEVDDFSPPSKNTYSIFDRDEVDTEFSLIVQCPLPRSKTETGAVDFTVSFLNGYQA